MSIETILVNILLCIKDLLPYLIVVSFSIAIFAIVLALLSVNFSFDKKAFKIIGIMFGLNVAQKIRLGATWTMLVISLMCLFRSKYLYAAEFVLLGIVCLVACINLLKPLSTLKHFFWALVNLIGLLARNLVLGYIQDVGGGLGFRILDGFLVTFLTLFSLYVFLVFVNDISEERVINIEKERDAILKDN